MFCKVSGLFLFLLLLCLGRSEQSWANEEVSKNVLLDAPKEAPLVDILPSEVILWSGDRATVNKDGAIKVQLKLETRRDFSIYKDKLEFLPPPGINLLKVNAPPHVVKKDPVSGKDVEVYDDGTFELELVAFDKIQTPEILFGVRSLGCTTRICLFPYTAQVRLRILEETPSESSLPLTSKTPTLSQSSASTDSALEKNQPDLTLTPSPEKDSLEPATPSVSSGETKSWEAKIAERLKGKVSFWLLVSLVFIGGLLTNLTPCVYPMIPITLRVLAHQGASAKTASLLYGLGILVTYTLLGLLASWSGSVFGSFMASPTFNLILAITMIIMGFTMLGYGNLSWLQNMGSKVGGASHTKSNAFLMGIGAGFVASPCTGPILASLLAVTSSRQDPAEAVLLLGVYSFGFALPYVLLGAFSASIPKKRFSPRVQMTVKTLFAGAIFSVSLIYLKIPFAGIWGFVEHYTIQLGRIFGIISLTMLGLILISKSLFEKKNLHILPAVISGLAVFCLFESRFSTTNSEKIPWITSEDKAYKLAKEENRPILVDTWAEWCIACKKMEVETFMNPKIRKELADHDWVLLKLDLTETNDLTDAIQEKYDIKSLPTVTIIPRGGLSQFENKRTLVGYQDVETLFQEITKERTSP